MTQLTRTKLVVAALLTLLLVPTTATADPVIAEIENFGDTLVFHPVVEFAKLILTVTGPCNFEYRQVVEEGEPFFRLDETTIDGRYTFNLMRIESVDPGIVKILKQARANNDDETPNQLCRDGKLPAAPIAQSAGFGVQNGKIIFDEGAKEKAFGGAPTDLDFNEFGELLVAGEAPAPFTADPTLEGGSPVPTKDFVINDDLIVDGSACIGFDCVNGEVFSFDTIRLKENNLRIKFDDTSVVPSFPANDWQLTANESANGGASKFSIEDVSGSRTPFTVEANARSHSLYVDDGGRIGSRTSTPSVEIHTIDGDTPTLRLQQDGSSGFEPQTWDVAGNETNFFIRDVTNGSTLPFRIRPSAPSNAIFVDVDGDVGLGTSAPEAELHVLDNGAVQVRLENTSDAVEWNLTNSVGGELRFSDVGDADVEMTLTQAGDMTITGTLTTGGPTCAMGCDRVFSSEYELESIKEHAMSMWRNSYLPAVGATPEDGTPFNLTEKTGGMLTELEKAHIYIEQLHDSVQEQQDTIQTLMARMAELEQKLEVE